MKTAKRHYVTYFDRNYLAKGVAMLRSLGAHERGEHTVFVVCMDELTRAVIDALALPNVVSVPVHDIERGDRELVGPRRTRDLVEYYWTLTPTIILRLLERHVNIEVLTYLDADLFFFGSPDPIFEELGSASVLIHEHRFSPDLAHLAENGRFNVGLLCFRNDERGLDALRWWRDRCNEWCFKRIEDGKMGDQLYLEDWPTRFEGVVVLQHIGGGLAPWNHIQYRYTSDGNGRVHVDGQPVIFYHFHSFVVVSPELVVPASHAIYRLHTDMLAGLFVPYAEAVADAYAAIQSQAPTFRFGITGARGIEGNTVLVARSAARDALANAGLPHARVALNGAWDAYVTPQLVAASPAEAAPVSTRTRSASPPKASIVAVVDHDDCACALRKFVAKTPHGEIIVACPAALANEVTSMLAGRPDSRVVVTHATTTATAAANHALALTRGETIVIVEVAAPRRDGWLDEILAHHTPPTVGVRAAGSMSLTRAQLERGGGLEHTFVSLATGLDDLALRLHAAGRTVAVEDAPRVYAPADWQRFVARWGIAAGRGQTGRLPSELAPPLSTLRRVALPDVARTHVVDEAARVWQLSAA